MYLQNQRLGQAIRDRLAPGLSTDIATRAVGSSPRDRAGHLPPEWPEAGQDTGVRPTQMDIDPLETLAKVAPPPLEPIDAGAPERWAAIENRLGTALPSDYKRFINRYGSGDFNDLIAVLSPFSAPPDDLFSLIDPLLEPYRQGRAELMPEQCPFPVFPEPGGLLPIAIDTHGGTMFWRTEGPPDAWTLVLYDLNSNYGYEEYPMGLVPFLAGWLTGELHECFFGIGKFFVTRHDPIFRPTVPGHARSRIGDDSRRD